MSASVKKFVNRAPRYTLQPTDNRMMRFAHEGVAGQAYATKIVDLSATGISFVADRENSPFIFEMIKVEIPLPNGEQIAWWGKVVRMEEYGEHKWYMKKEDFNQNSKVMIAVTFEKLPPAHVERIKAALATKFEEQDQEKKRQALKNISALWASRAWEFALYIAVVIGGFYTLWALSQPTATYDPEKGSPWGQRMWFMQEVPVDLDKAKK